MKAHTIADLRLRDDEAWLRCACGVTVEADDPERLNEPYQAHRIEVGEKRKTYNTSELVPPGEPIRWRNDITVNKRAEADRRYRERHPDRVLESKRAWREKNPERARELLAKAGAAYRARKRGEVAA